MVKHDGRDSGLKGRANVVCGKGRFTVERGKSGVRMYCEQKRLSCPMRNGRGMKGGGARPMVKA
jgi:hypothetical protein